MPTTRSYASPLRERQARETRELILATLTDLLDHRHADEVTTREIAQAAGVSERTVYRHFPDRHALLRGLTARLGTQIEADPPTFSLTGIDGLSAVVTSLMTMLERHHAAARAEALFNADPRRFSDDTRANSESLRAAIHASFPGLDARDVTKLVAVIRCLVSAQAWLRMREEFGVPGEESGPVVAWVLDLIVDEVRRGGRPGGERRAVTA
jgi:AcrR family transcriptional regulator